MTLDDAMLLGTRLHRMNLLDDAYKCYAAVLEAAPEHADALQFMGILEHQQRHGALAVSYLQRAVKVAPNAPGLYHNLGNVLLEQRRFDEAADAYERCVQLGGETAELLNNIGVMRRLQNLYAAAERAFVKSLQLDAGCADTYYGYGRVLEQQKRYEEALQQYRKALDLAPKHANARHHAAMLLCLFERFTEAAQLFRDWLAAEPDDATAQHYLAACTGEGVPARASDAFVASAFDGFAESFDQRLGGLGYRGPELVGNAVCEHCGEPRSQLDVLDAGCGTGLCASLLRPFARHLCGVDLSEGMLQKAGERGSYDALHRAELTEFIQAREHAFDLIVSADTLCYFGDLEPVTRAAQRALRPGGWLVFTVEALEAGSFALQPIGRYSHSQAYLRDALARAAFTVTTLEPAVLRTERSRPVHGYLVAARR